MTIWGLLMFLVPPPPFLGFHGLSACEISRGKLNLLLGGFGGSKGQRNGCYFTLIVTADYSLGHILVLELTKGLMISLSINRIWGKPVHARAWAHKRLQHHVSYVGIDMCSRTLLKTMYCTISNWHLTSICNHQQQDSGLGHNRTWLQHKTNLVLPSSCQHLTGCFS